MAKSKSSGAYLYNSQPHVNDVESGLQPNPIFVSEQYTFMLKHKHSDMFSDEVIWVELVSSGYDISVRRKKDLGDDKAPCMWLHAEGWMPIGYTCMKDGFSEAPEFPEGNYNLGVRWLNTGGVERTDDIRRLQTVRPRDGSAKITLVTMINLEGSIERGRCISDCALGCYVTCDHDSAGPSKITHEYNHRRWHDRNARDADRHFSQLLTRESL